MTVLYRDSNVSTATTGGTIDVTLPTLAKAGDLLIVTIAGDNNAEPDDMEGFTKLRHLDGVGFDSSHITMFYREVDGNDASPWTFTATSTSGAKAIAEVYYSNKTGGRWRIDYVTDQNATSGNPLEMGPICVATGGVLIGAWQNDSRSSISSPPHLMELTEDSGIDGGDPSIALATYREHLANNVSTKKSLSFSADASMGIMCSVDYYIDADISIVPGKVPKALAAYLYAIPSGGPATQDITPTFITSDEVVYEPSITVGAVDINSPTFITSDEVVYNPTVQPEQFISPTLITSDETFYEPSVSNNLIITPEFLDSDEEFYNPAIGVGSVDISSPTFITSAESVYEPTVAQGLVISSPTFITSGEAVYNPAITVGPTYIFPEFITSSESVYNPAVTGGDVVEIPQEDRRNWNTVGRYLTISAGYNLSYNDATMLWLAEQGSSNGTIEDRMFHYLGTKGYTGAMADRWNQWRDDA